MSSVDEQIISITRHIYGAALQTCLKLGLPLTILPNTTLNEKLSIEADKTPSIADTVSMRYLVMGNRGHKTVIADDGSEEVVPIPHQATDASLYGLIPLVLRETDNDLPAQMRAMFCLRRIEQHNGRNYIAYYGLRLDYVGVQPQYIETYIVDGEVRERPFVPTTDNLNPTPPSVSNTGVILGSDATVAATAVVPVHLSASVIYEIINAHRIRTGSTRSPIISEIAFCSGVDRAIQVSSGGGGSFTYNEVIGCQINVSISTHYAIGYSNDGATLTFDVGNAEPMLAGGNVNWGG